MIDMVNEYGVGQSIAPASITATTTGSAVDLLNGFDPVVVVTVGTVTTADTDNYVTFTISESDDNSSYTALASGGYLHAENSAGTTWDRIINATTEGTNVYRFRFAPSKRYVKVVGTETGTTSAVYGAHVEYVKRHA